TAAMATRTIIPRIETRSFRRRLTDSNTTSARPRKNPVTPHRIVNTRPAISSRPPRLAPIAPRASPPSRATIGRVIRAEAVPTRRELSRSMAALPSNRQDDLRQMSITGDIGSDGTQGDKGLETNRGLTRHQGVGKLETAQGRDLLPRGQ